MINIKLINEKYCIIFQSYLSMSRLFVNHLEAYLLFANKIFTMAIDSYKEDYHLFYNGIKFNKYERRPIPITNINIY